VSRNDDPVPAPAEKFRERIRSVLLSLARQENERHKDRLGFLEADVHLAA
jgi:hypothetical protein